MFHRRTQIQTVSDELHSRKKRRNKNLRRQNARRALRAYVLHDRSEARTRYRRTGGRRGALVRCGKGYKKQRKNYPSEEEEKELRKKGISITTEIYHLTKEEEVSLKQMDAAKTELVNIYRFKQASGKDRFDLAPEKTDKLHDDRAYVVALLAWQLVQLRRANIVNKKREKPDKKAYFSIRPPKKVTRF